MTSAEFLSEFENIVQADPGTTTFSDPLESLGGWDSMARVMFIAMADENMGVTLNAKNVLACGTIADLARLCEIEPAA